MARFGGVDVLVNNAGYGYRAAVEEGGDTDVQQLFATNYYAGTAGKRRKEHDTAHGNQPGDPARAAQALITASAPAGRRRCCCSAPTRSPSPRRGVATASRRRARYFSSAFKALL